MSTQEEYKNQPGFDWKSKKVLIILGLLALALIAIGVVASRHTKDEGPDEANLDQCGPEDIFNQATGEPCFPPCEAPGDLFNRDTGEACPPDPAPDAITPPPGTGTPSPAPSAAQ